MILCFTIADSYLALYEARKGTCVLSWVMIFDLMGLGRDEGDK